MSYRRRFDPQGSDSLARLARWVRPGATLLELGCATGYFTEHLAALGCTVDVIDADREAAAAASRFARRSVVADLDGDAWVASLGEARYDAIVCADVLEHLRDGAGLLRRLRPLLAEDGKLLLSVPNVAHSAVIAGLVDERFEYGGEGLLDPTHVRLYTWRSLAATLAAAGYAAREWDATTLAPFDTEFRVRGEALAPPLREALLRRPHAFVYQWLVRAAPGAAGSARTPPSVDAAERVPVRLLGGRDIYDITLDRAQVAMLPVGSGAMDVEWPIATPSAKLRLLLADRIGVIEVHALRLHAGDDALWSLDGDLARVDRSHSAVAVGPRAFALTEADAWLDPLVAPEVAVRADRMTATLAWPAGVEEAGAWAVFAALAGAREADRAAAGAHADGMLAALRAREAEVAALRGEVARLEAAAAAQERIIDYRNSAKWWLELPLVRARMAWRRGRGG
jgi:2-polyprenyl-3-methyl-5-hydroxy-6-metoxy-1,4-benzoquinol methylase